MSLSFKPATVDLPAIRDELLDLIVHFFYDNSQLEIGDFKLHLGLFLEALTPINPFEDKAGERAARLGYKLRHAIMADPRQVRVVDADVNPVDVVGAGSLNRMPDASWKPLYLDFVQRRADAVWDDEEEMRRCDFAFFREVAEQSHDTRRKNLGRSLDKVLLPDSLSDHGSKTYDFHGQLAGNATYAADGSYYAKWLAKKPAAPKHRVFGFDTLSDDYLRRNFAEQVVRRGGSYVLLMLDGDRVLFELTFGNDPQNPVYRSVTLAVQASSGSLLELATRATSRQAIFFHAAHGASAHQFPRKTASSIRNPGTTTFVVDPKAMVESKRGTLTAKETKGWTDWDWFVEMVRLHFPERVDEIYTGGIGMLNKLGLTEREQLYLNSFGEAAAKAKGPLKTAIEDVLKKLEKEKDIFILARGAPVGGPLRFIGTDTFWVYLYSTESRLTLRQHTEDFVYNFNIGYVIGKVYENTKHIIPFMKVLMVGATIVMTGGVLGAGSLAVQGGRAVAVRARTLVVSTGINATAKKVAIEAYKRLRPQLIALVIGGFLHFFPLGGKVRSFASGVLIGMSWDAMDRMVDKYTGLLSFVVGYSQYKMYQFTRRLLATVQKIEDKLAELADQIDDAVSAELAERFSRIPNHLLGGLMLVGGCLLLLDYAQVEPLLKDAAEKGKKKPLTRDEWEKLGQEYLKLKREALTRQAHQAVELAKAKTIVEAKEFARRHDTAIAMGALAGVIALVTAGTPLYWYVFVTMGVPALIADLATGQNTLRLLGNMLLDPWRNMDRYTEDEVEQYGRFLGHILGGVMMDRAIFKEGSKLAKLKEESYNPLIHRLFLDRIGHGVLLPIVRFVLAHDLILLKRLRTNAPKWEEKIEKAFNDIVYRADPDLAAFAPKEETRLSFRKLVPILKEIDDVLVEILQDLAATPDLDTKLLALADQTDLPFKRFADKVPPAEVMYTIIADLRAAISEFARALSLMFTPLRAGGQAPSIADLLHIVGLDIGTGEADDILARDLDAMFADKAAEASQ